MARSKTEFVGVIGLGNMGGGIARNLISAGHHVLVWDIADEAVNEFSRKATLSEPKEMVARCSIIFLVVPDIDERMTWMEKDLSAVLVQSERFKKSTRVFAKDNACASCHLDPDHLLHNLQSKYPSFSDIKGFMRVGHMRYYTVTTPVTDEELMAVYRTLK